MSAADDFARRMREAAETLRVANRLYDIQLDYGTWNPVHLLKEADVIEKQVDDDEIESAVQGVKR